MLNCSGYFLDCLQSCLIKTKKAKVAKGDLAAYSIREISTRDVTLWSVSAGADFAEGFIAINTYIGIELFDTKFWLSIK